MNATDDKHVNPDADDNSTPIEEVAVETPNSVDVPAGTTVNFTLNVPPAPAQTDVSEVIRAVTDAQMSVAPQRQVDMFDIAWVAFGAVFGIIIGLLLNMKYSSIPNLDTLESTLLLFLLPTLVCAGVFGLLGAARTTTNRY